MIKANEYSIGNYITYLDEIYVVNGITYEELNPDKWRIHFETLNGSSSNTKSLSWITPIPLSPEWLERCGFLQSEGRFLKRDMKIAMTKNYVRDASGDYDGFIVVFNTFTGTLQQVMKSIITVKYLHQLQNLYFALTGEELNVKL